MDENRLNAIESNLAVIDGLFDTRDKVKNVDDYDYINSEIWGRLNLLRKDVKVLVESFSSAERNGIDTALGTIAQVKNDIVDKLVKKELDTSQAECYHNDTVVLNKAWALVRAYGKSIGAIDDDD